MNPLEESVTTGASARAESYGIPAEDTTDAVAPPAPRAVALGRALGLASWVLASLLAFGGLTGCATTPITGKRAFLPVPISADVQLGLEALDQYVDQSKVVTRGTDAEMVQRVMERLVVAAGVDGEPYEWSVRLIDEPETVNAFALPGGPMAVYTGILPVTQTEAGLAVVMGHELGHVLARHGMQRVTRQQGAAFMLSAFDLGQWGEAAGLAYQFAIELPFGRGDESESDHIGLILMARAGYDPREAPRFWARMAELSGGQQPPEWMSTHPSHETRQEDLNALMDEALAAYQASGAGGTKQFDGR